ncbi:MAG: ferritin-like domain-containing protein [Sandaracinaceae bacterium]
MSDAQRSLRDLIHANTPHALRTYLRRLAKASVLMAGSMAVGCTSSHFPPETELTPPACEEGRWNAASSLNPALTHDYIGVYRADGMVPEAWSVATTGTACEGATDGEACMVQMDTLIMEEGTFGRFVVTTEGDAVSMHRSDEELLALLGPIDSPGDALLRAWHAGYGVQCDDPSRSAVREVEGGYEVVAVQSAGGCGTPVIVTRYLLNVATEGTLTVLAEEEIERIDDAGCAGRRPEGLAAATGEIVPDAVGHWLSSIGRLEASAVVAFESLARELEHHGAPLELVTRARDAAADEVRHAALMEAQAARFGARPFACEVSENPVRPLFAIALENAVEGCLRETYGALVAHHQALAASDPAIARMMQTIAEDESRHAELSWAVASWVEPQLTDAERSQLHFARLSALTELRAEMQLTPDARVMEVTGLPRPEVALAMLGELSRTLL